MANPPTPTPNGSRQGGPPGLHPAGFLNPRPRAYSFFLSFFLPVISGAANGMVSLVTGVFNQAAIGALMDGAGARPLRGCCKDAFFKGDAAKAVVAKKYKDEAGKEQLALWTTNDGCPVIMGEPRTLEYYR